MIPNSKEDAMKQGYVETNHIAYSVMLENLTLLLKQNKVKAAKEVAEQFERHPLYWYRKGGQAIALQEITNAQNT